jgi:hypothetical protein
MVWRVVLDPRIPDGLADLRAAWTLDDLVHATDLLDQLDEREAKQRAHARLSP